MELLRTLGGYIVLGLLWMYEKVSGRPYNNLPDMEHFPTPTDDTKFVGWEHDDLNGREKRLEVTMTQGEWDAKSPLAKLLASRKFLLMALDVVLALVLYFGTKYANPSAVEDIKQLILVLQPVVVTLIYTIAKEDAAESEARAKVAQAQAELEKFTVK